MNVFDVTTASWHEAAPPPVRIHHFQAIAFDDRLYVLGALTGDFPEETPLANVLIYDPPSDQWTIGPEIPAARRRGASGVVVDGDRILMVGGNRRGHMSGYVPWLDSFNPTTGTWRQLPDAPHARDHFHAVILGDRLYAAGGRRSSHDTGQDLTLTEPALDVYDLKSNTWSTMEQPLPTPRAGTAAVAWQGRVLIIGGESDAQVLAHSEVEAFDPNTQRWQRLKPLPIGRHGTQVAEAGSALYLTAGSANRGGGPELSDLWTTAHPASKD